MLTSLLAKKLSNLSSLLNGCINGRFMKPKKSNTDMLLDYSIVQYIYSGGYTGSNKLWPLFTQYDHSVRPDVHQGTQGGHIWCSIHVTNVIFYFVNIEGNGTIKSGGALDQCIDPCLDPHVPCCSEISWQCYDLLPGTPKIPFKIVMGGPPTKLLCYNVHYSTRLENWWRSVTMMSKTTLPP